MAEPDPIVAALAAARRERGLTQLDVAEHVQLERSTIVMYETGRVSPSLDVLCEWADLVGCDIALIHREES